MNKRIIFPAVILIASVLSLSGCKTESENAEAVKPLNEITADILDCGVDFPEMVEVAEENFQIKYSLAESDYEEYSLWWAGSGADADEICIIKAKDSGKVKDAVSERLEGQKEVFKNYVPEQYDKLCKAEVKTKGDYVYWLCTNNNDKAEKALTDDFT